ncbi:MAG: MGH1-like glycoside hydrolase domain-containing protein [Longimicrobiaceae bacterium]
MTDSSVRQGRFEAVALSRDTLVSTYPRSGREMQFRFSINGQDNEFRPGTQHTVYIRPTGGRIVSPVYLFGQESPPEDPTPEAYPTSEEGVAQVTIRLDLREVLRSFARTGAYDPPEGPPIRSRDFHVYVIGMPEPLTWDASALRPGSPAELTDPDGDSIYAATLPLEAQYTRPRDAAGRAVWARRADLSAFPRLRSPQRLLDALYGMSLEELTQLVRDDGALAAGAKWPGVWTRDVAYSSVLALAIVAPDAVRKSLEAKVDSAGRIIQDTGTGGSWPVSTDRMTWALAAWELYAVTGDRAWLRRAYDVIRRSAEADLHAIVDPETGLARGETSFMDWREQSYPRWMQPADIARSAAVGTNAVHYATWRILADMARALGEPSRPWTRRADRLRDAINVRLWQPELGFFATFRYGRTYPVPAPRSDALGEALAIIYGVASPARAAQVMSRTPVVAFGAPTFWPYIPNLTKYHNAALWPFVNAFWSWAAADAGNTAAVEHGLASIYRPAALFLTNKENMVAPTGHFDGTVLNSDRQLWSVAGNLATQYRVLFGMRFRPDRLVFAPMVPPAYAGERTLSNLRYRGAVLAVTVRGYGDGVASARLDGRPIERAEIPATLTGAHTLEIEMNGRWPAGSIYLVANRWAPETPIAREEDGHLAWTAVPGAARYRVFGNGTPGLFTRETRMALILGRSLPFTEYQVMSVDSGGVESFLSEPVRLEPGPLFARPRGAPLEREHAGFTGEGYVRLTRTTNTSIEVPVRVACTATYDVDARYANGNGPINTDAKAAVRTLLVDGRPAGVLVMPQRGVNAWEDWGYGTTVRVSLTPGEHTLTVAYTPLDENMDRRENTALLDHLRLTRISACR